MVIGHHSGRSRGHECALTRQDDIEAVDFVGIPSSSDLERYGLSEPSWIAVVTNGGETVELQIGIEDQLINGARIVYARRSDERFVYALSRHPTAFWILDPLYYRNRTLQDLGPSVRISALKVERLNGSETEVLDESIDLNSATWEPIPRDGSLTPDFLVDLIDQIKRFRVATYLGDTFDPGVYYAW